VDTMKVLSGIVMAVAVVLACCLGAQAVNIETVPVSNPGNAGELSGAGAGGYGPDRICGAVGYTYNIGKYEVTAGQYCEFLNAVAATDTYSLYNESMWTSEYGCKIQRSGSSGSYTYSVAADWADRSVNFVSWGDAARFANWLHNGQRTGAQDLSTTEDGAYYLNGATTDAELLAVNREADWKWAITSEDEWYKAAYHKNDGVTGNYFDYSASSDALPSNDLIDPDPGNNATFYYDDYTIGSPYWRTEVGAHENSESPYGTFDQGGNVWEWNEAVIGSYRGRRAGSFDHSGYYLHASYRNGNYPTIEDYNRGFRVSEVPEPAVLAWRSLKLQECNGGWQLVAIELDPAATGEAVTTESRAGGIEMIEVDMQSPVPLTLTGTVRADDVSAGGSTPASFQSLADHGDGTYTLEAQWDPPLPDQSCYRIDLAGNIPELQGDTDCMVSGLVGDTNGDGDTNLIDMAYVKSMNGADPRVPGNARFDVNTDGNVNLIDMALVKSLNGGSATCPCTHPPSGMVYIPAGEFDMGDTFDEGDADEKPVHTVYVDAFYMDRYELTNQQYADALNWAYAQGDLITVTDGVVYKYGSGTSYPYCDTNNVNCESCIVWAGSSFTVESGRANQPMIRVSWYGSVAYCNWRSAMQSKPLGYNLSTWECNWNNGYRLPTEAEWEKAARGGVAGRRFPWSDSDTIQHARANYKSYWSGGAPYYPYDTSPTEGYHPLWGAGNTPFTSPVGFFTGALQYQADWGWPGAPASYQTTNGANGYGLYDMAGNVWESCNDWYDGDYYSSSPYGNPHGPTSGSYRVLRGGGWYRCATYCRVANRNYNEPNHRGINDGFRCAVGTP